MKSLILSMFVIYGTLAQANVLSVNFRDANGTVGNGRSINSVDSVGAPGYQALNWQNTLSGQTSDFQFSDGTISTVGVYSRRPNGSTYIGSNTSVYGGSPLIAFAKAFLASNSEPHVELSNLNENFPEGYTVVVYVSGANANQGWSVTLNEGVNHTGFDKSTGINVYGKTINDPDAQLTAEKYIEADYSVSNLTDTSSAELFPEANYVVFSNQTADAILLTVDGMKNNQAGLGGFQIIPNTGYRTVNITAENGFVEVQPSGTQFEVGDLISLNATSTDSNYVFAGWSGDISGNRNSSSTNIIVQEHLNIEARFERAFYLSDSGNNSNNGSYQAPWRNLAALHWNDFNPGEQILFERGGSYSDRASMDLIGTNNASIVIGSYGSGEKPHLTGNNNFQSLLNLGESEYVEIEDLHFSNQNLSGAHKNKYAINIAPESGSGQLNHVWIMRCDFSNIQGYDGQPVNESDDSDYHKSVGIRMEGTQDDSQSPYWNGDGSWEATCWNDVKVIDCTFKDIDGIGFWIRDRSCSLADYRNNGTEYYPSTGVLFENNYGTNCYRNLCRVHGTDGALIQYNVHDRTTEGSAVWPYNAKNTVVQFNLFMNLYRDFADAFVCHFDYQCEDTLMQYNVGYKVEGGLVEVVSPSDAFAFHDRGVARYNLGVDVGFRDKDNSAGIMLSGPVDGAQIYNNTIITGDESAYKSISFNNWGGQYPVNCKIYNNIFYNISSAYYDHNALQVGLDGFGGNFRGNVLSHNLVFGNSYRLFNAWDGQAVDTDAIYLNPRFIDTSGNFEELRGYKPTWEQVVSYIESRYKINYLSPAISAGMVVSSNGGLDGFSNTVSAVLSPSVGFHEYDGDAYVDSDSDQIPDQWEVSYSLDPMSSLDAIMDSDLDGKSNLEEFAFNGDPLDAANSGYSVSYSININNGDIVVHQLVPNYNHLAEYNFNLNAYISTNLTDWVLAQTTLDGMELDFYAPGVNRLSKQLIIDQNAASAFFKTVVE